MGGTPTPQKANHRTVKQSTMRWTRWSRMFILAIQNRHHHREPSGRFFCGEVIGQLSKISEHFPHPSRPALCVILFQKQCVGGTPTPRKANPRTAKQSTMRWTRWSRMFILAIQNRHHHRGPSGCFFCGAGVPPSQCLGDRTVFENIPTIPSSISSISLC